MIVVHVAGVAELGKGDEATGKEVCNGSGDRRGQNEWQMKWLDGGPRSKEWVF